MHCAVPTTIIGVYQMFEGKSFCLLEASYEKRAGSKKQVRSLCTIIENLATMLHPGWLLAATIVGRSLRGRAKLLKHPGSLLQPSGMDSWLWFGTSRDALDVFTRLRIHIIPCRCYLVNEFSQQIALRTIGNIKPCSPPSLSTVATHCFTFG